MCCHRVGRILTSVCIISLTMSPNSSSRSKMFWAQSSATVGMPVTLPSPVNVITTAAIPDCSCNCKSNIRTAPAKRLARTRLGKRPPGRFGEADLMLGCVYDARAELKGWDKAEFGDRNWSPVQVDENVKANLVAHPGEPIRRIDR